MKLEAYTVKNNEPETIKQVSGKVVEFKKRGESSYDYLKPSANYFGAGLNNLTSYLDD
ncbi:hypothetical protein [Fusibacter sp. 3D3]|uniref:hypothetical protein n=1 Tax=Fusibacter sp. 3D3 TaxID=1048380 RepID=UPI0008565681|nr:hypothetical protein [Fusibacter sp. 3D3]GAU78158.1 hypothetical protein F3D3_2790 [Fusibacter sp. 3D3]